MAILDEFPAYGSDAESSALTPECSSPHREQLSTWPSSHLEGGDDQAARYMEIVTRALTLGSSCTASIHIPSSAKGVQKKSRGRRENITNEIRSYVRAIARSLIEARMLEGMRALSDTPKEFWKSFPRTKHSEAERQEFLPDKATALKFCKSFFLPACINAAGMDIDVKELCQCLQGPVLQYSETSRAFEAGPWAPAGLAIEAKLNGKCATGVGKRTAKAVLRRFNIALFPKLNLPAKEDPPRLKPPTWSLLGTAAKSLSVKTPKTPTLHLNVCHCGARDTDIRQDSQNFGGEYTDGGHDLGALAVSSSGLFDCAEKTWDSSADHMQSTYKDASRPVHIFIQLSCTEALLSASPSSARADSWAGAPSYTQSATEIPVNSAPFPIVPSRIPNQGLMCKIKKEGMMRPEYNPCRWQDSGALTGAS